MYVFVKEYKNELLVREDKDFYKIRKHDYKLYFRNKKGSFFDIYGNRLQYRSYNTLKEARRKLLEFKEYKDFNFYGAPSFQYQYINDVFYGKDILHKKDLIIYDIDIETSRDKEGYSSPDDARCEITAITITLMGGLSGVIVWSFGKDNVYKVKRKDLKYNHFNTEEEMLFDFISFFSRDFPHIITGWNIEKYDIPYIINRIYKLFSNADDLVLKLSPFNVVKEKNIKSSYGKEELVYEIYGVIILDYLNLYRKFMFTTPENYKLDTIAELELGEKKLDYSEYNDLEQLRSFNFQKFIDYNIRDTGLVKRLDDKLKLIDLVMMLAYKTGANYEDLLGTIKVWDVFLYNILFSKNILVPLNVSPKEKLNYVGGFVKDPKPALYKWVVSFDLNSLYPHLQMGINISPDKHLKNIPKELYEIKDSLIDTTNGIELLLNERIDTSALKKYNVSLSPNGQFYKRDNTGFIPDVLKSLYSERKKVKKSMLNEKQELEELKKKIDDEGSTDELEKKKHILEDSIAMKNVMQMSLKILMNSEYGAMANVYFRWFSIRNAEAVTSSGQLAIKWVAKNMNVYMNNLLKTENIDYVIGIDTDSIYINMEDLVNRFVGDRHLSDSKMINVLDIFCRDKIEPEIERIYTRLAKYINSYKQKMVMKREVIASKGIWTGKKRYILLVHDSEGVKYPEPKLKVVGIESKRSSTPNVCRGAINDVLKLILTSTEEDVQKYIESFEDKFYRLSIYDVSYPRGVNNIEKWEEGTKYKSGTPIQVSAAITYNNYVKKYFPEADLIMSGDKIKFVYLKKPNYFSNHVIGFPPNIPKKLFNMILEDIDYDEQFKSFLDPVERILKIVNWSAYKVNTLF